MFLQFTLSKKRIMKCLERYGWFFLILIDAIVNAPKMRLASDDYTETGYCVDRYGPYNS